MCNVNYKECIELFLFTEPGLLEALKYRVEAAEQKFRAAELDDRLSEFEAARQRQVTLSNLNQSNYD